MKADDPRRKGWLEWLKQLEFNKKRREYKAVQAAEWVIGDAEPATDDFAQVVTGLYLEGIAREWQQGWRCL